MGNSSFTLLLLGVLGLLLAREGVDGLLCYDCHDCASLSELELEGAQYCSASCMVTATCHVDEPFVTRGCSVTNQDEGCFASQSSANTYECYCNDELCDPFALNPEVCDTAATTLASLALVFSALLPSFLLR